MLRDDLPAGISDVVAEECMARLRAGSSVRKLTSGLRLGHALVTRARFKKHCELHPEWGAEAWRISKANTKAGRGARFRAMTHCKHGHPLSGDNLYMFTSRGRQERKCVICNKRLAKFERRVSEDQARRVVESLNEGRTLRQITKSGPSYVLNNTALLLFRKRHPKFDRLVLRLSTANAKVHLAEAGARRAQTTRAATIAAHGDDYFDLIQSVVPSTLPIEIRKEVISAMASDVVEAKLRAADIRKRAATYVAAYFKKNSKYGDRSLDAHLFHDGNATLLDRLSTDAGAGYWDINMMASTGRRK